MRIPLIFSFWFMVAAYVIHVIDESLQRISDHDKRFPTVRNQRILAV